MPSAIDDLWKLVQRPGAVDAMTLLRALADATIEPDDGDPRTPLLMRDAGRALTKHFGDGFVRQRVPAFDHISRFDDGGDRGFPTLEKRIVDATDPRVVRQIFAELGQHVRGRTTLIIGGSIPLILKELLTRKTDDADVVDEVPVNIREEYALLDSFAERFGIRLSHFQSHYLPEGWRSRIESFAVFDELEVYLVDPIDVLTGKLFSQRPKDWRDLSVIFLRVDRDVFADRVRRTTDKFRQDPAMLASATGRWAILTGEKTLPSL